MPDEGIGAQKFSVPEPLAEVESGFLTDYWQLRQPLPTIKSWELWLYFLQRGVMTVLALPMSSAITVLTMAVSLFLLAGFLLVLQNVDRFLTEAGSPSYLTAYIREGAAPDKVSYFVRELEASNRVRSVRFISKEDALTLFRKDLGDKSSLLAGLDEANPLPASVDVVLHQRGLEIESLESAVNRIKQNEVVDEVVYGSEWVQHMKGLVKVFRLFGTVSIIIALLVVVFLISNTIKLVIYARRDEISIMQLVGASDTFVKLPFVIGGLLQGLTGAILGLTLLKLSFLLLDSQLSNSTLFGVAMPDIAFLSPLAVIAVMLFGTLIGAVGSLFALGRFMNV